MDVPAVFGKCSLPPLVTSRPPTFPFLASTSPSVEGTWGFSSSLGKGTRKSWDLDPQSHSQLFPSQVIYQVYWEELEPANKGRSPPRSSKCPFPWRAEMSVHKAETRHPDICLSCRHLCLANAASFISPWGILLSFSLTSPQLPARSLDSEVC